MLARIMQTKGAFTRIMLLGGMVVGAVLCLSFPGNVTKIMIQGLVYLGWQSA
jgi:hypothetical protein